MSKLCEKHTQTNSGNWNEKFPKADDKKLNVSFISDRIMEKHIGLTNLPDTHWGLCLCVCVCGDCIKRYTVSLIYSQLHRNRRRKNKRNFTSGYRAASERAIKIV